MTVQEIDRIKGLYDHAHALFKALLRREDAVMTLGELFDVEDALDRLLLRMRSQATREDA